MGSPRSRGVRRQPDRKRCRAGHQQPVVKVPLHSTGDASRRSSVARRSNIPDIRPLAPLIAGRLARLGASGTFTTDCSRLKYACSAVTASRSLRVGLVGYGLGGSTFHAPLISATPGLELAAIATSDAGRVQAAAARYPQARIVPAADQLFTMAPALDLVVVSTPHHTHAPLARAALAAGCHVVVDKPFAVSADEARELAALAARYGRLAIPFQNRRWDADILTLQRLLREGALGTVHRFESRYERWRPTPKPRWTVEGAGARGEGLLLDLMVHLVDQALLLFGPARDVYAEFDRRHPQVARRGRRVHRAHPRQRRALAPVHQRHGRHRRTAPERPRQRRGVREVRHGPAGGRAARRRGAGRRRLGARGRDELGPARRRGRDPHRRERARRLPALLRRRGARTGDRGAAAGHRRRGRGNDGRARSRASLGPRASRGRVARARPVSTRPIRGGSQ